MASPLKPSDLRGAPFRWDEMRGIVDRDGFQFQQVLRFGGMAQRTRLGRFIVAALNAEAERMRE